MSCGAIAGTDKEKKFMTPLVLSPDLQPPLKVPHGVRHAHRRGEGEVRRALLQGEQRHLFELHETVSRGQRESRNPGTIFQPNAGIQ